MAATFQPRTQGHPREKPQPSAKEPPDVDRARISIAVSLSSKNMAEFFLDEPDNDCPKSHNSETAQTCPLCGRRAKRITCQSCISSGDFSHSTGKYSERYLEKRKRLENLKITKEILKKRVLDAINSQAHLDMLNRELIICRDKVQLLKEVMEAAKHNIQLDSELIASLKGSNNRTRSRLKSNKENYQKMQKDNYQIKAQLLKGTRDLAKLNEDVYHLRRSKIENIQKYLFPIQEQLVFPVLGTPPTQDGSNVMRDIASDVEGEEVEDSCETALAEATRTSYIKGRWVSQEEVVKMEYSIIDTTLPGSGDYSSYLDWGKQHKTDTRGPDAELGLRNPAFIISAALSHMAQFVELLASYLDVNLPKKLSYSEFCQRELNRREFRSAVNRLNANVLHLCFSQNVEPTLLNSRRTLQNLYTCLNSAQLGWGRPFECHPELLSIGADDSDHSDFGSDREFNSESDAEWETLPRTVDIPEAPAEGIMTSRSVMSTSAEEESNERGTATSLVSSAAASVAALWPWKKS